MTPTESKLLDFASSLLSEPSPAAAGSPPLSPRDHAAAAPPPPRARLGLEELAGMGFCETCDALVRPGDRAHAGPHCRRGH